MISSKPNTRVSCLLCPRDFKSESAFEKHLFEKHDGPKPREIALRPIIYKGEQVSEPLEQGNYLYWIRSHKHTDPFTEGYIGVSKTPTSRLRGHMKSKCNAHFFDDPTVQMEILHEYDTEQEPYDREREYRPEPDIGWNRAKGGGGARPDPYRYKQASINSYDNGTINDLGSTQYFRKDHDPILDEIANTRRENTLLRNMVDTLTSKNEELQRELIMLRKEKIPVHSDHYAYRYPSEKYLSQIDLDVPRFGD